METALRKNNKKGFTLVELVIVIAVLAILAAIAVPTVTNIINTANINVDASNAQTIELALKTADAEIKAGTADSAVTEDALVVNILPKYGISLSPTATTKSGGNFAYSNKTIVVKTSDKNTGATTITPTTKLSDILS